MSSPIVKVFVRPEMELPVYSVTVRDEVYYMQREENNGFYLWYEVVFNGTVWVHKGNFIGFTKKEAISHFDFITA